MGIGSCKNIKQCIRQVGMVGTRKTKNRDAAKMGWGRRELISLQYSRSGQEGKEMSIGRQIKSGKSSPFLSSSRESFG
ncbi:unnamed protein product [Lasius platythorax]|uniref:Uncharacterized protein n=1 Tax=Lasius platythorax TaxID=488582 RepID=A0AAV2N8Y7_9HYME